MTENDEMTVDELREQVRKLELGIERFDELHTLCDNVRTKVLELLASKHGKNLDHPQEMEELQHVFDELVEQYEKDDLDHPQGMPAPHSELRKLLLDYHELCEEILDIQDEVVKRLYKRR